MVMSDQPDWDLDDDRLRRSGTVKWTYQAADVLPAWVAEMDVAMAPVIRAAVDDALDRGMVGYPPLDQVSGLGDATAGFLSRRFGLNIDAAQVVSCGDVMAGVKLALELLCDKAPVVVPLPAYPPFLEVAQVTGRALFTVPCQGTTLDVEAIGDALAAGARTVLLSTPHNPLGRVFDAEELAALRDGPHPRRPGDQRRDPCAAGAGRRPAHPVRRDRRHRRPRRHGVRRVEGVEPARAQVRPADRR
jgi:cystathionine beta-lyase